MRWPIAFLSAFLFTTPLLANDKIAPLLPERTIAVLHLDVRELLRSPLGKKTFGKDAPAVILQKVLRGTGFGDEANRFATDSQVAKCLNNISSITIASMGEFEVPTDILTGLFTLNANGGRLVFIESKNTEDDYLACAEEIVFGPASPQPSFHSQVAKVVRRTGNPLQIVTEKNRRVLRFHGLVMGAKLSDTLFVWTDDLDRLFEVLERNDNKKKFAKNDQLLAAMKKIDTKESPFWFAHGREFRGIGVLTTNLTKGLELNYVFRGEDGLGNFLVGRVENAVASVKESVDRLTEVPGVDAWTGFLHNLLAIAIGTELAQLLTGQQTKFALSGLKATTAREKNTVTGKLTVPEKLLTNYYKNLK